MVQKIFTERKNFSAFDLACSAQTYLARGLAQMALAEAERLDIDVIGLSGGVAYNQHIVHTIRNVVVEQNHRFLVHHQIPPGDGGLSFGQVIAATAASTLQQP